VTLTVGLKMSASQASTVNEAADTEKTTKVVTLKLPHSLTTDRVNFTPTSANWGSKPSSSTPIGYDTIRCEVNLNYLPRTDM